MGGGEETRGGGERWESSAGESGQGRRSDDAWESGGEGMG